MLISPVYAWPCRHLNHDAISLRPTKPVAPTRPMPRQTGRGCIGCLTIVSNIRRCRPRGEVWQRIRIFNWSFYANRFHTWCRPGCKSVTPVEVKIVRRGQMWSKPPLPGRKSSVSLWFIMASMRDPLPPILRNPAASAANANLRGIFGLWSSFSTMSIFSCLTANRSAVSPHRLVTSRSISGCENKTPAMSSLPWRIATDSAVSSSKRFNWLTCSRLPCPTSNFTISKCPFSVARRSGESLCGQIALICVLSWAINSLITDLLPLPDREGIESGRRGLDRGTTLPETGEASSYQAASLGGAVE